MSEYPTIGVSRLMTLVATILAAVLGPSGDPRRALNGWIRAEADRGGADAFVVKLFSLQLLIVASPALSAHILGPEPDATRFVTGFLKRKGMSFLAPRALTISDGGPWRRLRRANEAVLCTGRPHDLRASFLPYVGSAFATPATTHEEIRVRMGRVMMGVVFGSDAPSDLPRRVDELMRYVANPIRRSLLGRFATRRRTDFYTELRRRWQSPQAPSLAASFRATGAPDAAESLEQIPHWMFTFTGSGTDLLFRTLTLVGSRPSVLERALREIEDAGPLEDPASMERLPYVEACLRETGRLYAPVSRTFHRTPVGEVFDHRRITPTMEIVHFFPVLQRDTRVDPAADLFRPERWLEPGAVLDDHSNVFLSGSRACPGRDLILFVCKAAAAYQLGRNAVRADAPALETDPLPVSYPRRGTRLTVDAVDAHTAAVG